MPPVTPDVFQKPADDPPEPYNPRGRLDPQGFERHVTFRTFRPPEPLATHIAHFWALRWEVADGTYESSEVMHRPYTDLFLSAGESGIQGTFRGVRTYPASGTGRIIGARFNPGAFRAFWSGEMSALQDRVLVLSDAFPDIEADRARILSGDDEAAVGALGTALLTYSPKTDDNLALIGQILNAIEQIEALMTVAAVSTHFQRSERALQQLFRDYLGVGLKWFIQRHRLLRAAETIRENADPDWADLAYELGYSSQAHFITDFRTVLGMTPVQYRQSAGPITSASGSSRR